MLHLNRNFTDFITYRQCFTWQDQETEHKEGWAKKEKNRKPARAEGMWKHRQLGKRRSTLEAQGNCPRHSLDAWCLTVPPSLTLPLQPEPWLLLPVSSELPSDGNSHLTGALLGCQTTSQTGICLLVRQLQSLITVLKLQDLSIKYSKFRMQEISKQAWPAFSSPWTSELYVRMAQSPEQICKRTSGIFKNSGDNATHYFNVDWQLTFMIQAV